MDTNNDIVIIELDKPRELKLGHRALKTFCARTKLGVDELTQAVSRYDVMSLLIAIMLQVRYPELEEDRIDELLDNLPLETVIQKASDAIYAAFPSAKADAGAAQGDADYPFAATTGPRA